MSAADGMRTDQLRSAVEAEIVKRRRKEGDRMTFVVEDGPLFVECHGDHRQVDVGDTTVLCSSCSVETRAQYLDGLIESAADEIERLSAEVRAAQHRLDAAVLKALESE